MNHTIELKLMSSMEKCFLDEDLSAHPAMNNFTAFRGERLSFQLGIYCNNVTEYCKIRTSLKVEGTAAKYVTLREVASVPVQYPVTYVGHDEDVLRQQPGIYPDVIRPLHYNGQINVIGGRTVCVWFDVQMPDDAQPGRYTLRVSLSQPEDCPSAEADICLLAQSLPEQRLIHTEWFYTDCIAETLQTDAFSERHWKSIEAYIRTAVDNGINMILTPVLTPELDTYVGGERMTTQLVDVSVTGLGRYDFDFKKLNRFIAICKKCGVRYYEIPHFFTQWGAHSALKVCAKVKGRARRIFGWETEALGTQYTVFLSQFIPALLRTLKENGIDRNCFFHVSDEPSADDLEHYKACRQFLLQYLADYPIIDALSDFDFYKKGASAKPVPSICHIDQFLEHGVPGLWAYYAGNSPRITGRCISMPLYRTRILGVQLWKYDIEGFLHWGYNYYHNQYSYDYVDPFGETGGEYFTPAGDAFLVYPAHDGTALESLRLNAMREAVDDMRALDLLQEKKGRQYVVQLIDEVAGMEVTFTDYPRDAAFFFALRERIIKELAV